jgi:hypothetical protein
MNKDKDSDKAQATTEATTKATTESIITEAETEAETEAVTEAVTEAETEAVTEAVTEAETEAVTEAETEAVTESASVTGGEDYDSVMGVTSGDTYTNALFGFKYTVPSGQKLYTEDELKSLNSGKALTDVYDDMVNNQGQAIVMCSANMGTGDTCNIVMQKSAFSYDGYDMGELLGQYKDQIGTSLQSQGYSNVTADTTTVQFLGKSESAIKIKGDYMGVTLDECCVCLAKGNYLLVVTTASMDENNIQGMFDSFSKID